MGTPHDAAPLLLFAGAVLARHQPQITGDLRRSASPLKSTNIIERGHERGRRDRTNTGAGGQSPDDGIIGHQRGEVCVRPLKFCVDHDMLKRREAFSHGRWEIQSREARPKCFRGSFRDAMARASRDGAGHRNRARARIHELMSNIQVPLHRPLARRSSVYGAIDPMATRLGERGDIAAIRFHAPASVAVHQPEIWVGHDDLVPKRFEVLGDPPTLGRGLD
jgi:hypothetical protein